MQLFKTTDELEKLAQEVADSETGELTEEQEARLDSLQMARQEKVQGILHLMRKFEGEELLAEMEEKRIAKHKIRHRKSKEGLKDYLKREMLRLGEQRIEGLTFRVWLQRNAAPSVTIDVEPEQLPEVFRKTKVVVKADKEEIAAYWKKWLEEQGKEDETPEIPKLPPLPEGVKVEIGKHLRTS